MKKKWIRKLFRRRVFICLMLLMQMCVFIYLILSTTAISTVASILFTTISVCVAIYVASSKTKPAFKLTWMFNILIAPVFGGLFYLFWEGQKPIARAARRLREAETNTHLYLDRPNRDELEHSISLAPEYERQLRYLESFAGFPSYTDTRVDYLSSGERKLERLLCELEKAEKYIFIEYFIIEEGVMWDSMLEILRRKVAQGVLVRVLYDDFGCFLKLPSDYVKTLASYGIEAAVFNPFKPFFTSSQNNRDHRKIVSIDGRVAFTGGINIADEYINVKDVHGHWKDTAVCLTGGAAWSFTVIFLQMWAYVTGKCEDCSSYRPTEVRAQAAGQSQSKAANNGVVLPYCDSPLDDENVGEHVYLQMINTAKRYLYIDTPYLILDDSVTSALCLAAKSGVDVRITTPHVPDHKFVHDTTRTFYEELIRAGVRVYEYASGFIHAKTFVSDDITATVGTANLDFRSLYLHFECGVWLYGCDAVREIRDDYLATLESCTEITPDSLARISLIGRMYRAILRLYSPLM